jgi:hypothetical protein
MLPLKHDVLARGAGTQPGVIHLDLLVLLPFKDREYSPIASLHPPPLGF